MRLLENGVFPIMTNIGFSDFWRDFTDKPLFFSTDRRLLTISLENCVFPILTLGSDFSRDFAVKPLLFDRQNDYLQYPLEMLFPQRTVTSHWSDTFTYTFNSFGAKLNGVLQRSVLQQSGHTSYNCLWHWVVIAIKTVILFSKHIL